MTTPSSSSSPSMGRNGSRLTTNTVDDVLPAWSPDHARIAFARKARHGKPSIWVMSASGARQHRLRLGTHPSWSPSGSQLVFDRDGVIYTMNDHGRQVRRMTRGTHPVWAPRGKTIAFERGTTFFVTNVDTRAVRLLANPDSGLACERYGEGDPAIDFVTGMVTGRDATPRFAVMRLLQERVRQSDDCASRRQGCDRQPADQRSRSWKPYGVVAGRIAARICDRLPWAGPFLLPPNRDGEDRRYGHDHTDLGCRMAPGS